MLRLLLGRAGTGKTARIISEIANMEQGSAVLLVPEQYSHEAERELCRTAGDGLPLYAEVLSFTGLARAVEAQLGGIQGLLDKGGKLLCAALSIDAVATQLKVYSAAHRRPELQKTLLDTIDELKSSGVEEALLADTAANVDSLLGDKLNDLSLILGAYNAIASRGRFDPSDRLTRLKEQIGNSEKAQAKYFVDGFTDFTAQEIAVLCELLRCGADVTVCLTCPSLDDDSEVFELSRRTAFALIHRAKKLGIESASETVTGSAKATSLAYFEKHLFEYNAEVYDGEAKIGLYSADSIERECRAAAAEALRLVYETGCRWRDIAIAVRGFEDYRFTLERVFDQYNIPLYAARKSDILSRTLPTLISSAFDILSGGFRYDDMFAYLKTGLTGLEQADCDLLENYAFLWGIRGSSWTRATPWTLNPAGYGARVTDESEQTLARLNELRLSVAQPLKKLQSSGKSSKTAAAQVDALCSFFDDISLAERLEARADSLRARGEETLAAEYVQLWDIVVGALEQCSAILGDTSMTQEEFAPLFKLVLSQYSIGTIPVSLDRVSVGDMDRMRRRRIKHLLVLGASDARLPADFSTGGVFSADERQLLFEQGLDIGGWNEDLLSREFGLIYNCLTLPSHSLYISYCTRTTEGAAAAPSFVLNRACALFDREITPVDTFDVMTWVYASTLELAADTRNGATAALALCENKHSAEQLYRLRAAASLPRGSLSGSSVRKLYGDKLRLSPTRIDKLSSCRFSYFLQYGLRAAPRKPAGFNPPEYGTFMHFVLEGVTKSVMERGGFGKVPQDEIARMCNCVTEQYIHDVLDDFCDKSERFVYLFRRLTKTVRQVVADMAGELALSDFSPLDFELRFSENCGTEPITIGDDIVTVTGIADRVDGWLHDGKLYLRVVDYKTGKKSFSLSDVWYGMGLQMLLYLFTLEQRGEKLYSREIVPAGVMYVPARDILVRSQGDLSDEKIIAERMKHLRRSGLVLDDEAVIKAMERSDTPKYIPVKFNKDGVAATDSLVTAERLGLLSRHIERHLTALSCELKNGSITADPYYRSQQENACIWCEYRETCLFDEEKDSRRYQSKLSPPDFWAKLEGVQNDG